MKCRKRLAPHRSHFSHYALFALSVLAGGTTLSGQVRAAKPGLIEGTWIYRGPTTVVSAGSDTTVILRRETNEWTITFDVTTHQSVNQKAALPTTSQQGPYKVAVEDQELVLQKDGQEVRYTFICDSSRLILPAIVQKKPGEWVFRADRQHFIVRCENDPFRIPMGRAEMQGVLQGKGFYSFEEAPVSSMWPRAQYLRFLERSDDKGQLYERFRLIFDAYGSPRYEKILQAGERSTSDFQLRVFIASNKAVDN
jgi:hypothetical protein